jgi:hypothetical protein
LLNRRLLESLLGQGLTLKEAIGWAKAEVEDEDVRTTWILLGDPAMRIGSAAPPAGTSPDSGPGRRNGPAPRRRVRSDAGTGGRRYVVGLDGPGSARLVPDQMPPSAALTRGRTPSAPLGSTAGRTHDGGMEIFGDLRQLLGPPWSECLLILSSFICGAIVGVERERQSKPAGLRTLILICIPMAESKRWITVTAPVLRVPAMPSLRARRRSHDETARMNSPWTAEVSDGAWAIW